MHRIPRGLAPLAFIAGPIYEAAVRFRNTLYESSILQKQLLKSPVVSIGNITTGGTGKTPLVIYTANKITELGFIPAILSRGYGRPNPGTTRIISPGKSMDSPVSHMGDEPALIRRHVPEAWFGISKDRYSAGSIIEERTDRVVFILDDGFQHRHLHRDLDIVVIDPIQQLKSNHIFPRGTLREPVSGLHRSHAIILNGIRNSDNVDSARAAIEALHLQEKLFYCEQSIERLIPFDIWKHADNPTTEFSKPESAFVTAALGNPERFHRDILNLGVRVCGTLFFKDHYRLKSVDWALCVRKARKASADAILVSEKDAIKILKPPDFPLLVAMQTTRFPLEKAFTELLHQGINASLKVERQTPQVHN